MALVSGVLASLINQPQAAEKHYKHNYNPKTIILAFTRTLTSSVNYDVLLDINEKGN